jgi:hypothetical protein
MFSRLYLSLAVLLCAAAPAAAQKFFIDDPIDVDRDNAVDVGEPRRLKLNDYYDFLENTFSHPGDRWGQRALNANTLGEVPDSSWFENRHGRQRMTESELVRGPNQGSGPSIDGPWVVTDGKSEGITPGFRIRDSRGDFYVIKFDPLSNPEMATAAEIISTKFFYAIGYNVPENYLVSFRRGDLRVDPEAEISVGLGPARRMTDTDLDNLLDRAFASPDKAYRAVASKLIEGRPIGPFKYYGTRPDDPNDIIPHEDRRELRGLRVFAEWLNHDDSRAVNTQDTVVHDPERSFIRHYLIDFGSTLGSGSVQVQKPRAGWEYMWEPGPTLRRVLTLGLWDSAWVRVHYPKYASIGRFESKVFTPDGWKPEYPNPAFRSALPDDLYWAAKIVMSFTDDDVRAIVHTGGLTDPNAEQYLVRTLIERRDKIGRYYFNQVLPVDGLTLEGNALRFRFLPAQYDFSAAPQRYTLLWFRFDNAKGEKTVVIDGVSASYPSFEIPAALLSDGTPYFGVEVRDSEANGLPGGGPSVSVFLSRLSPIKIVGIERTWRRK